MNERERLKTCSEENSNGMAAQKFDKEIMVVTHGFNQPSQQKPEMGMELHIPEGISPI